MKNIRELVEALKPQLKEKKMVFGVSVAPVDKWFASEEEALKTVKSLKVEPVEITFTKTLEQVSDEFVKFEIESEYYGSHHERGYDDEVHEFYVHQSQAPRFREILSEIGEFSHGTHSQHQLDELETTCLNEGIVVIESDGCEWF